MRSFIALALAFGFVTTSAPVPSLAADGPVAAAAVRSAHIKRKDGTPPRGRLDLKVLLALTALPVGFDPAVDDVEVRIGGHLCVAAEPGDGAVWARVRKRPWTWRAKMKETPGCAGKARLTLDLRGGMLKLKLQRIDALPAMAGGASRVPVQLTVAGREFRTEIDFSVRGPRWKFKDPWAALSRGAEWDPHGTDPGDDPSGNEDGPVAFTEIRSDSTFLHSPRPHQRGMVKTEADWESLWSRDWAPHYGSSVPSVDFSSRMVVTFAGEFGAGFESVSFERRGDNLVGSLVVTPRVENGYARWYCITAAFIVPRVPGNVRYEIRHAGSEEVTTMDCPLFTGW